MKSSQPESSSITASNDAPPPTTSSPVTSSVSIKLPPYWPRDPALWFSQVEAQFTIRGITSQSTKYAYVVGSLQPEVAQEVRDLLIHLPVENPYTRLKAELVKRTSATEQQRLHQLLHAEELGDRKPTQLLRRMQQLLGENTLEPAIMKQLFLQRLPINTQLILASTKDDLDAESLAWLADKIVEIALTHATPPSLSTVVPHPALPTSPPSTELCKLQDLVAQLTTTINNLHFPPQPLGPIPSRRTHPRTRSPSPSRPINFASDGQSPPICWYHTKFGTSAKKCSQPCSFPRQPQSLSNYNARQ